MPEEVQQDTNLAAPPEDASNTENLPEDGKTATDSQAGSEQETAEEQEGKNGLKRGQYIPQWRVDEITRERRNAERERDAEREKAAKLERELGEFRAKQATKPVSTDPASLDSLQAFIQANPHIGELSYPEAEKAWASAIRNQVRIEEQERITQESKRQVAEKFINRLSELPESKEIEDAIEGSPVSEEGWAFIRDVVAPLKYGPEVFKEAILDDDLREQLVELDKQRNGNAIANLLHALHIATLRSEKNKTGEEKKKSAPVISKAPAPARPVSKPSAAPKPFDPMDENIPAEEWIKQRNKQVAERNK